MNYKLPEHMRHLDMLCPANRLRGPLLITTRGRYNERPRIVPEQYLHMAVPLARKKSPCVRPLPGRSLRRSITPGASGRHHVLFWFNDAIGSTHVVKIPTRGSIIT